MRSKILAALAVISMLGAGGGAAAQSAAPLSLARSPAARTGAALEGAGELRGPAKWILGAVVLGLVVWGIVELFGDDEEAFPVSP